MLITDVEGVILRQPGLDPTIGDGTQDTLLVLVATDDGLVGIGEVDSSPEVAKAAIDAPASHSAACGLREALVGEDAIDIDRLWQRMYRASISFGRRGAAIQAISGIEIALWDIAGKRAGVPAATLLGPAQRDHVRAYASVLMPRTEGAVQSLTERLMRQGFTAAKFGWGPLGEDPKLDVRLVQAAADTAQGRLAIMVDAGFGYSGDVEAAIRVARAFEDLQVAWLEEPFEPDETEAYATLADAVDLPIAAGENEATRWGFRELIDRAHVDICQPDVTRCGGLRETMRIAEVARASGKRCITHSWKTGIIKAATLQVNAVLPEAEFLEYCVADTPLSRELTVERFPIEDGSVTIPSAPGIGVTLDPDVVLRYAVTPPRTEILEAAVGARNR